MEAPKGDNAHDYTLETLKLTIDNDGTMVDELQAFKSKRGGAVYVMIGITSESEILELRKLAIELRDRVLTFLKKEHKSLVAGVKTPTRIQR